MTATLLASVTDTTAGSQTTTVPGVTTTSGATLLILAYRQGTNSNLGISSISGTAISGTPAPVATEPFNGAGGTKFAASAWQAAGGGIANGTVSVRFASANNVATTIDVVQLAGNNTTTPVAGSAVTTGTGTGQSDGIPGHRGGLRPGHPGRQGRQPGQRRPGAEPAARQPATIEHPARGHLSASARTGLDAVSLSTWMRQEVQV